LKYSSVNINFCVDYYCSFEDSDGFSLDSNVNLEEKEKLVFICSCAIECVKDGGSVLIPINRLGTILQLLEEMATLLEASAMEVSFLVLICLQINVIIKIK
jgi:integrator complex subunit 9